MPRLESFMSPRARGYFTPIAWEPAPSLERVPAEWKDVRTRFEGVRGGDFAALDGLAAKYPAMKDRAARVFTRNLLGDAGTDTQLEEIRDYVLDTVDPAERACELCHALGLWGHLRAARPIFVAYDRHFGGQYAEGLPAYLTTMFEPRFGPLARHPEEDTVEAIEAYEAEVDAAVSRCTEALGEASYVQFGARFSVQATAKAMLARLEHDSQHRMMRPYLRQRFEACTGIDCSDFYVDDDDQPLVIAQRLETWLAGAEPKKFVDGERYFFGHWIPRKRPTAVPA